MRIKAELEAIGGFVWVTEGREIENYVSIEVFARAVGKPAPDVGPYERIPELSLLSSFKENKVAIAHAVAPYIKEDDLKDHLDLWPRLQALAGVVRRWNALPDA